MNQSLDSIPFAGLNAMRKAALASLASMAIATSAFAQPSYTVSDLAVLPGYDTSVALGVNDAGDVAGYCTSGANQVAVVWHNGQLINLGKLTGGTYAMAVSINSQGITVGDGDTGDGRPRIWVNTATGLYNFFSNNGGNTHAIRVGDSGFIGGYYTKSLSGNTSSWRASIWTPDPKDPRKYRQMDLPVIPGINSKYTSATAWAFNQSAQAAGWAVNDIIGQHACFWNNDATHSIVDLGTYPGDWSSIAWGMNDLGQVVGESHPPSGNRAIIWNNDPAHTPTELPLLPGDNVGSASRVNNLGHALGWSAFSADGSFNNAGPQKLVLWRDGGVFDLQTVLDPVTGAGCAISTVAGINNSGQIVGLAVHNGQNRAYLLTPITQ